MQSFARHVPKEVAGRFYRLRKVYTGPLCVEQSAEPAPYHIGRTGETVSSPVISAETQKIHDLLVLNPRTFGCRTPTVHLHSDFTWGVNVSSSSLAPRTWN